MLLFVSGRMLVIGLILGPFNHHWYRLLDQFVTGSGLKVVAKKIAADQAVAGPFFCTAFLIGMVSNTENPKPFTSGALCCKAHDQF